jgi:hypothetical protein
LQNQESQKRELKRVTRAAGLHRYEESARTEYDFEQLTEMYDKLDDNRERKERYWEKIMSSREEILSMVSDRETVIPPPLDHVWWRELLGGNFIDTIFDCPHEITELVSSRSIYDQLVELDENRREILYYRIIRQWSPQKIAAYRGQSDRNIRKVYDVMIKRIRKKLFARLSPRFEKELPLTFAQREFCKNYINAAFGYGKE